MGAAPEDLPDDATAVLAQGNQIALVLAISAISDSEDLGLATVLLRAVRES
ncbi:hypothetical protein H5T57_06255 [Candidatus Bipolaricaulota bacterium]|nr:hypothetical protein [Candidatus Bipolaricaulota bacterium]